MIPFSVLDLAPVAEGSTIPTAFKDMLALARHAEALGYHRFWLAEHHNMPGIASAATAVLIGYVAGGTTTLRVGAGGIMLPNHSPLQVAEQFGTLQALHGERIDLGLGRAPGSDHATARALRRYFDSAEAFPNDVLELLAFLEPAEEGQPVRAVPGAGSRVPVWLLGSSLFSARLAAHLGLPYAFASHFAPAAMETALDIYRTEFRPSRRLQRPCAMLALNVIAADTEAQARREFTSLQQTVVNGRRNRASLVPAPVDTMDGYWTPVEQASVDAVLACSVVGDPDQVRQGIRDFIARHRPDELIITSNLHGLAARKRSLEVAISAARD